MSDKVRKQKKHPNKFMSAFNILGRVCFFTNKI